MINIKDYYTGNSLKMGRRLYIPKQYLACFSLLYGDEKITNIFKRLIDVFESNYNYRDGYYSFVQEAFELTPKNKIIAAKTPLYEGKSLANPYPFEKTLENGQAIIKKLMEVEDLEELPERFLYRLLNVTLSDVQEVCQDRKVINCGVDQNVFDFTIARECLLNKVTIDSEEIAKQFFDLLIYGELINKTIQNVRPENKERCLKTIRALSLASFDPRFEVISIEQLGSLSLSQLVYYFGNKLGVLVNVLNFYSEEPENVVPELINQYLSNLDKDNFDILSRREKETLETIGQDYGLTRERIRQIEAKEIEKFNEFYLNNFSSGEKNLIFIFPYVSNIFALETFKESLGDNYDCFRNLMQSITFAGEAKYHKEIDAVVSSERIFSYLEINAAEVLGTYFKKSDFDEKVSVLLSSLSGYGFNESMINRYIASIYREKGSVFVKKHFEFTKVYKLEQILENHFDDGFHFSDEGHIKELNAYSFEEFGEEMFDLAEIDLANPHSIQSVLERSNVRMIGRGTYVHTSKANELPIDLVEKIVAYLNEKGRALAYSNIFETFQNELVSIGIDNRYALQGAMSIYVGELFKSKRDYVSPIEENKTLRENIDTWLSSRTGIFTYKDFVNEFKGVAQSVFLEAIYKHGSFVNYYGRGYVNINCLNISQEEKTQLKQLADSLINQNNNQYCTSDNFFDLISLKMPDFIKKCEVKLPYDLFGTMQELFKGEYLFKRPLFGSQNAVFETYEEVIDEYLSQRDVVKLSNMKKYVDTKLDAAQNKVIPVFTTIKNKWNEFVAVDADTLIRKEKVPVTESKLASFDLLVSILLCGNESLNIEESIVGEFPYLDVADMPVNKYLVFGLLNTYFHNEYEIVSDGNKYRGGNFFVKNKEQ